MSDPAPRRLREEDSHLGDFVRASRAPSASPEEKRRAWQQVQDRLRRRETPRLLVFAVAAACGAALVLAVRALRQPERAQQVTALLTPVRLEVHQASVVVFPHAEVAAREERSGRVTLGLAHGSVGVVSQHRAAGAPLVVDAANFHVTVVGTVFTVEREAEVVRVRLGEGTVHITGPSTDVMLHAPATWASPGRAAPAPLEPHAVSLARKGQVEALATDAEAKALALYDEGRTLAHTGQALEAAVRFRRYRTDYPQGALVQEASLSLIEALLVARPGEARAEVDDFLTRFPSSERRATVLLVKANLLREEGSLREALTLYDELVRLGKEDEDALYFAAICEARLGHAAATRADLKRYLQRWPQGRYAAQARQGLEEKP